MLTVDEKKFLLKLARKAIAYYFKTNKKIELVPSEIPTKKLVEPGACFVTLRKGKELRGCIGSLEAHQPLFKDVIDNALAAAFGDPRFYPLTPAELNEIKISISYLTPAVEVKLNSPEEILEKLEVGKHGLIIQRGWARATFLPAVWEELPSKIDFLQHLSIKAGLGPNGWRDKQTKFFIYEAEEFSE
ncbi:MAG: AmmeMemoRadiSam system protein A [Candidatus Bilamarchaeaceae archaeon]